VCALDQTVTFGVVGGYGATGRVVVSELSKSSNGNLLIGGRDLAKGKALAAEFGSRVSAAYVDILDARSLDDFCTRCSIIVNCAGPVMLLEDRVAQAAFRQRRHYVDAAGMALVRERLLPHGRPIADLGLSFVVSAGWMPGISEVLPVYAEARARAQMDGVESLTAYFGDSGDWSANALRDAAWYVRRSGLRSPDYFRYFRKGEWTRAKMSARFRTVNLGSPIGRGRFCMFAAPELREVGQRLSSCDFLPYTYLSGMRTIISATLMALFPLPDGLSVRMMRNIFRRNRLPVDGFVVVQVLGHSGGHRVGLSVQMVYRDRRDYWIHGLALATVARMISEGKRVQPGVHFLADAVDPLAFIAELQKAGVEKTETFEPHSS